MAEEKETVILDFKIEQGDAIDQLEKTKKSIIGLKEEQAALQKAYKSGSITLDEYSKETVRVEAILKKQTSTYNDVQKSVTGVKSGFDKLIESNKGIGAGIDKLVPGLGGMASGFTTVTATAKAFLATPIGAVIGALGLAIAALTQYFKGSEEGQNRFNKIMQVGGVIMERITDLIELVGKKVYESLGPAFEFVGKLITKVASAIGVDTKAVSDFFTEIDKRAEQFAGTQRRINELERNLIVERAKTNKEVAELIIKSQESEGQAKLDAFNKAIALQKKLLESEKAFAQARLDLVNLETEDDPTIENRKKQAEAVAELYNAEASYNEGIKKLNGQRIALEQEITAQIEARNRATSSIIETEKGWQETQIKTIQIEEKENPLITRISNEKNRSLQITKTSTDAQKEFDKSTKDQTVSLLVASSAFGTFSRAFGEQTAISKALSSAQAVINTYLAATQTLKEIPFPFNLIAAGAVTASGLASVAKINGVGFSEGGYTGPGGKYQPAGVVHAGEVVWNQSDVAAVGGPAMANRMRPTYSDGGIVAQGMTARAAAPAGTQSVEVALVYREFREFITAVKYKEQLTTA